MTDEQARSGAESREELERRTMKLVRRTGYVVFFGAAVLLAVPMLIGGIRGLQQDRIWDPITGEPVSQTQMELTCLDESQQLIFLAGQGGQWTSSIEQRYRLWLARCQSDYGQAYDMLLTTRTQLRSASGRPAEPGTLPD